MDLTGKTFLVTGATDGIGKAAATEFLFTKELQRRLEGTSTRANCFHPGVVRTRFGGFGADMGFVMNLVYEVAGPFSKTPEQGAETLIWLATSREAGWLKGEYVVDRRPGRPAKQALDPKLATDLWELSEALCAQAAGREAGRR